MHHPKVDPMSPANMEAICRLGLGEDIITISSVTNLSVDVVSFLRMQYLVEDWIFCAKPSRVSPLFRFDSSYFALIEKHFGQFPRAFRNGLIRCWNPAMFVRAFTLAIADWIILPNPPVPVSFLRSFVFDCIQLPYGQTLVFSIAGVLRLIGICYSLNVSLSDRASEMSILAELLEGFYNAIKRPRVAFHFDSMLIFDIAPNSPDSISDLPHVKDRQAKDLFNLSLATLKRTIQNQTNVIKGLKLWNGRQAKRIADSQEELLALQAIREAVPEDFNEPLDQYPLLNCLADRAVTKLCGTPTDRLLLLVSLVVSSYSYTGYEFLRTYLPLPHRTTLNDHFIAQIKEYKEKLLSPSMAPSIVLGYRHTPFATLAVDACATDSVFIGNRAMPGDQPSNAFIIQFLPLSTAEKGFPIHVLPHNSGSGGEWLLKIVTQTVITLRSLKPPVRILFIATDGDPSYNHQYRTQFNKWFPVYRDSGLSACIDTIARLMPLYVADFLHLIKNVRSRFIKYLTGMSIGEISVIFWSRRMQNILDLGPVFSDQSSTGKMRDVYPITLFRLEHVIKLFEENCPAEALYLLPWALLLRALQSSIVTRGTRIRLLQLAMKFLVFFYQNAICPSNQIPEKARNGSGKCPVDREPEIKDCVRPFLEITLLRGMNTVIGLLYSLLNIDEDIPLDRIGTHPLENFFGLMRRVLHDCNRFDEFIHGVARTIVIDKAFEELRHTRKICGRKNVGGVVCTFCDENSFEFPFEPEVAYEAIQDLVQRSLLGSIENIDIVPGLRWLRELNDASITDEIKKDGTVLVRSNANSRIMAGLIKKTA
jgi:hypothetical protein